MFPACRSGRAAVAMLAASLAAAAMADEKEEKPEARPADPVAFGKQAAAAVQKLAATLGAQLKAALEAGGPLNAVAVCQAVAGPITEAVNRDLEGLRVRRTSLKTRNPANAPDEVDRRVLERLAGEWKDGEGKPDGFVEGTGEDARFYKPIAVQAICLNCHGPKDAIDPGVAGLLQKRYPDDRATGYREGELRGVFRVEKAGTKGGKEGPSEGTATEAEAETPPGADVGDDAS